MSHRNIVIFGGSFCPVHIGHIMVGAYVAQFVDGVDEVWYMLSARNPLKPPYSMTDEERMKLLRQAVEPYPFLRVDDLELRMPRPSFTIDTLRRQSELHPDSRFTLLMGSDNILELPRWKDADAILRQYGILVYPRPGYPITPIELPDGATLIPDTPRIEISSTFIRQGLEEGKDMRPFLPPGVTIP